MNEKPLRLGIIGVGQIGTKHLEAYAKLPGVTMVAAADASADALARAASTFAIEHTYTDFRKLLSRDDLDAVDVCLHNNLHAPVSIAVMESGKHCYCEKPMAGSYADAATMFEASRRTGRMLSIQLAKLFVRDTRLAKRLIDGGMIGTPYHARAAGFRRRGRPFVDGYGTANFVQKHIAAGGALFDMGVYHISRALYLLGCPTAQRISGKTHQQTGMDARRRESSGYNVEELGLGFVKLSGGITLDIAESWAIHLDTMGPSYIAGDKGGIKLEPLSFHATMCDFEMNATFDEAAADIRLHQTEDHADAYDSPQHHWCAALRGQVELLPTDRIALQTMLISEGIYLSDKLGREVAADEVVAASKSTALTV
jgi:predicted dehydrogenase